MLIIILKIGNRLFCSSSLGLVTLISMGKFKMACTMIKVYSLVLEHHPATNSFYVTKWSSLRRAHPPPTHINRSRYLHKKVCRECALSFLNPIHCYKCHKCRHRYRLGEWYSCLVKKNIAERMCPFA